MRIRGRDYEIEWLHLAFITLIAIGVLWYLFDARSVSLSVNNLLLIQPLAIFTLVMYVLIVPQCFRRTDAVEQAKPSAVADPLQPQLPEGRALVRVGLIGLALGGFVFSLNTLGFDVAIWLFVLVTMAICGERRPIHLIVYPVAVTLFIVYGFGAIIPYPMTTTFL